jgi:hypothetical protein
MFAVAGLILFAGQVRGEAIAPMRYVFNGAVSPFSNDLGYPWRVLEEALVRTRTEYGPFALAQGPVMTETRRIDELRRATGAVTVIHYDANAALERELIPVRIPVERDLVGYRIFLVRRERLEALRDVATLEDLKPFSFGLVFDWSDVEIVRKAGLSVVTGTTSAGLIDMLYNERFDILPVAASSAFTYAESRRSDLPDLEIEPRLCLYYPMPMYFWFSRSEEGKRLAERVESGLREMIEDGTFERMFDEHHGPTIERLGLRQRRVIRIENPNLPPDTPLSDPRLWFTPEQRP